VDEGLPQSRHLKERDQFNLVNQVITTGRNAGGTP
jgi:hypothetical protein